MDASRPSPPAWPGVLLGLGILAIGIAIGRLWSAPDASGGAAPAPAPVTPRMEAGTGDAVRGPFSASPGVAPVESSVLETLELTFDDAAVATLVERRSELLQRMRIERIGDGVVPATVTGGGRSLDARVRLKGDQIDHLDTTRWSMRIELEGGRLFGMARFSIQHPKTRGLGMEWLVTNIARREGLLAPRGRFVNVVVNGRPNGIHYLEEHSAKELLESQGRREGPIVRFLEGAFWAWFQHFRTPDARPLGIAGRPGNPAYLAEIAGYGEKRLTSSEPLSRQLQSAIDRLRDLQLLVIEESFGAMRDPGHTLDPGRPAAVHDARRDLQRDMVRASQAGLTARLQAAELAADAAVGDLIHLGSAARAAALLSVFGGTHGMTWHNMRFYHDPVRGRLELIVNDTGARARISALEDPFVWSRSQVGAVLARHPRFYRDSMEHLARMARPGWLAEHEAALGAEFGAITDALFQEGLIGEDGRAAAIWTSLRARQSFLADLMEPRDPVSFLAELRQEGGAGGRRVVAVEAWSTTRVPLELEGFEYSNGERVPAASCTVPGTILRDGSSPGSVVLPWDGTRARFEFTADDRLDALNRIQAVTAAVKERRVKDESVRLRLDARFRMVGSDRTRTERLRMRGASADARTRGGRPTPPPLPAAVEQHPFLGYDPDVEELFLRPGTWDVTGDLVVPVGFGPLHIGPGTTLRFEEGAVFLSEVPLIAAGRMNAPITLTGRGDAPWGALLVIDQPSKSVLDHVHVVRATAIDRGGWISTGGATFYRSPVELRHCVFEDARGEDALNVFGTEVLMDDCTFRGTASDAFDGDFVTGLVRASSFSGTVEDAVDTSGSDIEVEGCRFTDIGDKAISGGEGSRIRARGCTVDGAAIGAASKDASRVELEDTTIGGVRQFGLASYMKKEAFGPSVLVATDVALDVDEERRYAVQEGSVLTVDGVAIEGAAMDVKALYEAGILGAPEERSDGR